MKVTSICGNILIDKFYSSNYDQKNKHRHKLQQMIDMSYKYYNILQTLNDIPPGSLERNE